MDPVTLKEANRYTDKLYGEVVTRDQSVNLLDWSKLEPGGYYSAQTGRWVADPGWWSTPLLPVKPGETYTKQSTGTQVTYWDANGDYVEGRTESNTFTVPNNPAIRYCRYPISTYAGLSMFVKGTSQPSIYVPYYDERVLAEGILITEGLGLRIVPHGTNLLDISQLERGYWHYETGEPVFHSSVYRSPKVRVFNECSYEINSVNGNVVFFDAEGNYITGYPTFSPPVVVVPPLGTHSMGVTFSGTSGDPKNFYIKPIAGYHKEYVVEDVKIPGLATLASVQQEATATRIRLANSKVYLPLITPYDDGREWEGKYSQVTHPSTISFDEPWNGYKYWMAITPYPNTSPWLENPCVFASNDGINWVTPNGLTNPLDTYSGDYNSDTHILFNPDTGRIEVWWRRYVEGTSETLYRRTSDDGVTWSARETMLHIESSNVLQAISPSIIWEDGKYRMWVMRDWYVHHADSVDGKTWSSFEPVLSVGAQIRSWHPNVQKFGDLYYMVNCKKDVMVGSGGELLVSTSTDGLEWSAEKLILTYTGNPWDYDGAGVYRASLIKEGDVWWLYYGMYSHDGRWLLGMSTGRDLFQNMVGIDERALRYAGL